MRGEWKNKTRAVIGHTSPMQARRGLIEVFARIALLWEILTDQGTSFTLKVMC